jgi:hypothetical protein
MKSGNGSAGSAVVPGLPSIGQPEAKNSYICGWPTMNLRHINLVSCRLGSTALSRSQWDLPISEECVMRDLDVRTALRRDLHEQHLGDDHTLIVEEMGIWSGSVRVDIAVVNGELHGFEIKSARDTLARLPGQERLYSQVFDRVTLVVAEKHAEKAEQIIPSWWGTVCATSTCNSTVSLLPRRPGSVNPQPDSLQTTRLLWRDELLDILDRHEMLKGLRSAPAERLCQKMANELPQIVLRREVRETLKRRLGWSRKRFADECEMAICVDLDPLSAPPSTHSRGGNRGDPLICPTSR